MSESPQIFENIQVTLPDNWEDALGAFKKAKEKIKEDVKGDIKGIRNISWHHTSNTIPYNLDKIPSVLNVGFNDLEVLLQEKWFRSLLRLIFRESLKVMGLEKNELEAQKSRFGELLKGRLNEREYSELDLAVDNSESKISFKQANKYAWGSIKKDLKRGGVKIENDDIYFYLEGVIKTCSERLSVN